MKLSDSEIEMIIRSKMKRLSKYSFFGHCFGCGEDNRKIIFTDIAEGISLCNICWATREIAKFKMFGQKPATPADVTVKSPEPAKTKIPFNLEDFLK